ncbi:MAG: hypothetical protein HYY55_03045 [Candidatus Niyogibacteria bacterium]|nr:MAG: hypothetical protein HYY55_03045 [Candidatus Niyogibacteria bacterium]
MRNKFLLTTVLFLAFLTIFPAGAQIDLGTGTENFFIELIPTDAPGPNQNIIARVSAFSFELNSSQITWIHNGAVALRGTGLKEYGFTTGDVGKSEILTVVAIDVNGIRHETEFSLVIADVDILWRAATSIPFWYKGKALASPKSAITASAFPNLVSGGRKIPASGLIYRWTLDNDFKQAQSGAGRNTFTFGAGFSSDLTHIVNLEVSNLDGNITAKKSIDIGVLNPSILVYENDALSGPKNDFAFQDRRNDVIFAGEKKSFIAHPFFFSLDRGRENLEYVWSVDGRRAGQEAPQNILNLGAAADAGGSSVVEILIKNTSNILQEARQTFTINVL